MVHRWFYFIFFFVLKMFHNLKWKRNGYSIPQSHDRLAAWNHVGSSLNGFWSSILSTHSIIRDTRWESGFIKNSRWFWYINRFRNYCDFYKCSTQGLPPPASYMKLLEIQTTIILALGGKTVQSKETKLENDFQHVI